MKTKQKSNEKRTSKLLPVGETEGARRATGVSSTGGENRPQVSPPDPEVNEKKPRRNFTANYKLKILERADACTEPGQLGRLLREEGLYSSNLTTWRRQRASGILNAMSPKKRGRKAHPRNALSSEVARLQKENQKLKQKLRQAELIIDAQKKISEILGISQNQDDSERNS